MHRRKNRIDIGRNRPAAKPRLLEGLESRVMLTVAPAGPEFQVNTFIPNNQVFPAVAVDADGDSVVVWESDGQDGSGNGIFGKRFDAGGIARGDEFRVNDTTFDQQYGAAVDMDDAGNFVVAWTSFDEDTERYDIYAKRYNANGDAQGSEFRVNTFTASDQTDPSIAVDSDGDFVVVWQSYGGDGNQWGVSARRFNAAGVAQGDEFVVNQTTAGTQAAPKVDSDAAGNFAVTWHSSPTPATAGTFDVYARGFLANGTPTGNEERINTTTAGDQAYPDVAVDGADNVTIVWQSSGQDGSGYGIFSQRFNATGSPLGGETQVNQTTVLDQSRPAVAAENDGEYTVAWQSDAQDGDGYAIIARSFSAAGAPTSNEVGVNTTATGDQAFPSIDAANDTNYVVVWDSPTDGGDWGVYGRRLSNVVTAPPDTTAPTVDITDVTPDPRTTPVDTITIVFSEPVQGFDLSDLSFNRETGPNLLTNAQTLTTTDNQTYTLGNLAGLTGSSGNYTLFFVPTTGITDVAGNPLSGGAIEEFQIVSTVVGRSIFYNNSAYDGNNAAATPADDGAIAPDKQALRPGQTATFANVSSYSKGINGIIIDITNLTPTGLTFDDFDFKVGNDNTPDDWTEAPQPTTLDIREGAGAGGSDRVTLIWNDGAISNTWLRVIVLPTVLTGLVDSDISYFGNLKGETGDDPNVFRVNAVDLSRVRAAQLQPTTITTPTDVNRDGRVNAVDLSVVRANQLQAISTISPPAETVPPPTTLTRGATSILFSDSAIV